MLEKQSDAAIVAVNEWNFEKEVRASRVPVFVDVTAEWCAPCRAAAPLIASLAERYAGRVKFVEIDGGESAELVAKLMVRGFPTFIGFLGGEVVERVAGFSGKAALEKMVVHLLERQPAAQMA